MAYEFGKDNLRFSNCYSGSVNRQVSLDDVLDYLEDVISDIDSELKIVALQRARGVFDYRAVKGRLTYESLSRTKSIAEELYNTLCDVDDVDDVYVTEDFAKEICLDTISYDSIRVFMPSVFKYVGECEVKFCVIAVDKEKVDYTIKHRVITAKCYEDIVKDSAVLVDTVIPDGAIAESSAESTLSLKRAEYKLFICRDCGKVFELSAREMAYYTVRGMDLPKRCQSCRSRRKQSYDLRSMLLHNMLVGGYLSEGKYDSLDSELKRRHYKDIDEAARKHLGDEFVDMFFRSYGL